MNSQPQDNQPKEEGGNIFDSLTGDGTKSQDASNPVNALRECINFGFLSAATGAILGGVSSITQTLTGGLENITTGAGLQPAVAPTNTLDVTQSMRMGGMR